MPSLDGARAGFVVRLCSESAISIISFRSHDVDGQAPRAFRFQLFALICCRRVALVRSRSKVSGGRRRNERPVRWFPMPFQRFGGRTGVCRSGSYAVTFLSTCAITRKRVLFYETQQGASNM
jgi:hypothetical protein